MVKELAVIWDTPSTVYVHKEGIRLLEHFLEFFNKVHLLYWSKKKVPGVFSEGNGKVVCHPYCQPYDSGYITGLRYMIWIGKTLWGLCKKTPKSTRLVFLTVIPVWSGIPTLIVGKLKRKKVVLRLDAQKIDYLKLEDEALGAPKIFTLTKVLILKVVYFLTMPFFDVVVGISSDVVEEAKKYRARKAIRIPVPIKVTRFKQKKENFKQGVTILAVGQIKKRKGFGEIITALQLLKRENDLTPKLLIVGGVTNPRDERQLKDLKKSAEGLDVEFRGQILHDRLLEIYSQADIFVHASYVETLGMVIMEAMASSLPVIATETSGAKDLVEDNKTGFLVPSRDPLAIKEKIKILIDNPGLRESMGRAGRKRIERITERIDEDNRKLWREF